ncbi:ribosome biogenesis protein ytm1 [Extremus antarcticus]|uniref:Ribosome biogenesis protein ytm1 n=1 Tax=Extremus antarcticus TaxID=702011 RepID=A0AAJ0G8M4_9PEZI|nr:ribosome biogenesis protein ytm1 [Extremus antarcticus]
MATADPIPPAILSYVTNNIYPDDEQISSSTLSPTSLSELIESLRNEQESARTSIRALSRTTAPDTASWISHAKSLQTDILKSRDLARQIIAEAETGRSLKDEAEDQRRKVELLAREVQFNEGLTETLESVRNANGLLERAAGEAATVEVKRSFETLEEAEALIDSLDGQAGSRTVDVLREKVQGLRNGMTETTTACWDGLITISAEDKSVRLRRHGVPAGHPDAVSAELDFDLVAWAMHALGIFDAAIQKSGKEMERAVLRPRMSVDEDGLVGRVEVRGGRLSCEGKSRDVSEEALFEDLRKIIDFLSEHLPESVAVRLSAELVPMLASRLEGQWLEPAVPVEMEGVAEFQTLLGHVEEFASHIEGLGWSGTKRLRQWVEQVPRAWLTKRREVVLGDVRNLVFEGLRERKTVERVETRVVSKEDMGMAAAGDEDDWDEAWEESEENKTPAPPPVRTPAKTENEDGDDDASAWDVDDDDPLAKEPNSAKPDDETEAWGWGDEDSKAQPASPVATKKPPPPASTTAANGTDEQQQSLTLRETFTTTSIPAGILAILQTTISDATTLASSSFSSSPLAPAAAGLYTLPTLALAIYRATAPTAYAKIEGGVGNMLIYNDALHLASLLRKWQSELPAGSSLRVDADVEALEVFAKRAYGSEMDAQRTILLDLLDGAQGFGSCTQQPFKQECESAVEGVVGRLRDVHKIWRGVLSEGALLQGLGSLLGTVTGKMITEIEDLGDISETESQELKSLCDTVLSVRDVFTQPAERSEADGGGSEQGEPRGEGRDMSFVYCPTWLKFQYLAEILESSLADIRWMWGEGELSLEFGAEEVVELVEALFAESELRRGAVREIRRGR